MEWPSLVAEDEALAQLLLWVALGEAAVLLAVVVPVLVTVQRHYGQWLVLRTRGNVYTTCMTLSAPLQIALALATVVVCAHYGPGTEVAALVLTAAQQLLAFAVTGVLMARQLILGVIFGTAPFAGHRPNDMARPLALKAGRVYVLVPLATTLLWASLGLVPQLVLALNSNAISVRAAAICAVTAALLVSGFYGVVVVRNRTIHMTAFCDYRTNIATFVLMIALTVVSASVTILYASAHNYWLSSYGIRSCVFSRKAVSA